MSIPIEGLNEPKVDGRTREARAMRSGVRGEEEASGRPDIRPDSVREAEIRAREIMESLDGDGGAYGNELDIPPSLAPDGWTYELKATSIAGMENRHHMLERLRQGWRPVPASRHPNLMPAGYSGPIEIKGLQLMERPTILVQRAKDLEHRASMDQLRNAEAALADAKPNTGPRDHPGIKPSVKRELVRAVETDRPSDGNNSDPRG
jgi:hypothetical protein